MAQRPSSMRGSRPSTVGDESAGVRTLTAQSQNSDLYSVREVATEVTGNLVQRAMEVSPAFDSPTAELEATVAALREELARVHQRQAELERHNDEARKTIEDMSEQLSRATAEQKRSEDECAAMRQRAAALDKEAASTQPTSEFPAESTEEQPLLAAAYQQISVLNTQLAHLYTELTMARTEVQHLRGAGGASQQQRDGEERSAEQQRQTQQIADLVGDIRHLQLDLEYHQQKLDQMLEEKQGMIKELKKCKAELQEAKRVAEEREQLIRHRDVDLQQMKTRLESPRAPEPDGGMVSALRTEAAAKDSALIVSHYELHKEKLLRDRLEQKNMKLMERMQKLMMVVETMRKENLSLEKAVQQKDRAHDEKDAALRTMTQKAKQLQRLNRSVRSTAKAGARSVELDGLPPLTHRSMDSELSM